MTQFHVTGLPTDWQPVLPFTEPIGLKFDERVNVFVGPNAVGKSTILRELLRHRGDLQRGTAFHTDLPDYGVRVSGEDVRVPGRHHGIHVDFGFEDRFAQRGQHSPRSLSVKQYITDTEGSPYWKNEPCWVYIPAIRPNLQQTVEGSNVRDLLETAYDVITSARQSIGEHIATQQYAPMLGMPYQDNSQPESAAEILMRTAAYILDGPDRKMNPDNDVFRRNDFLYDPNNLYNTIQFIEGAIAFGHNVGYGLGHVSTVTYRCTQEICPDILNESNALQDLVVGTRSGHSVPAHKMSARSQYHHEGNVFTGDLSAGTQGTLLWIWHLAMATALHHQAPQWDQYPCVLVIDEIENHLHPTWQRRVIPALLKLFPRLQIFATTHSPFVIAGLKAGQVHLLNRNANGVVTASSNTEDIIGWTADEILRVFMGVDDPTDDATAAAARELRQLRDAGPHPDEREEELRQARMRELQRQVDRSLLAGGPRAAEDERFAENLAGILERYRQSRDLNQENG